jgi:hypothetical protein
VEAVITRILTEVRAGHPPDHRRPEGAWRAGDGMRRCFLIAPIILEGRERPADVPRLCPGLQLDDLSRRRPSVAEPDSAVESLP